VRLVIEIDINAGLRVEGIADARDVPPVDLMRVRPERNHADLPARVVGDIEPDAPRIMAAADFEMAASSCSVIRSSSVRGWGFQPQAVVGESFPNVPNKSTGFSQTV
jgi:hypothetical protein